jgi:hypothetical protein
MKSRPVNGRVALFVPLGWLAALLQACSRDIHVAADLGAGTLTQVADAEDAFGVLRILFAWGVIAGLVVFLLARFRERRTHTRRDSEEQKHPREKYAFERTFFPLFRRHQELVQGLRYTSKLGIETIGQDGFEAMREDFFNIALPSDRWGEPSSERYEQFYLRCAQDELGAYFRNLYQLVNYIDASQREDKRFYVHLVRAQLSNSELYLLFYNGLSRFGREKFLPLLRKYEFFETLPVSADVLQADAERYGKSAFGQSPEWAERFARRKGLTVLLGERS